MEPESNPPAFGPADWKKENVTDTDHHRVNWVPWLLGIIGVLIASGVIASVSTYGMVSRIDENLGLFREQVQRDFQRHEKQIEDLDDKIEGIQRAGAGGVGASSDSGG